MPSLQCPKALSSTNLISFPTSDVVHDVYLYFLALNQYWNDPKHVWAYTVCHSVCNCLTASV